MKNSIFFTIVLGMIFLNGCLVRTYTIQKPRSDLDIQGNRGYIYGTPKEPPPKLKKTRTITVFEIELGSHKPEEYEALPSSDEEKCVEKIEPQEQPSKKEEILEEEILKEESISEEPQESSEGEEMSQGEVQVEKKYFNYTVKKNDTLQKISKKFYGTTRKWPLLYQENKDLIKSPDKIYPGMVIKIPVLE